jgi:predicted nuclease of predicted toxin-antitoxin system
LRFLIDADLPRTLGAILREFGHEAQDVRDLGMASADDTEIAALAQSGRRCIVTGDFGFADIRNFPPGHYHGIVVLQVPYRATTPVIETMLRRALALPVFGADLTGSLLIVDAQRIRVRREK